MPSANPVSGSGAPSKPISISFGISKPRPAPPAASKKRPHAALADHSGSEDEGHGGHQLVTAFDQSAGGAVTLNQERPKEALVIKVEKNRDWREESRKRRRKNLLPAEVQAQKHLTNGALLGAQIEKNEVSKTSGLQFVNQDGQDTVMTEGDISEDTSTTQLPALPKTADEEALASLLGKGEKKSTLTIPALNTDQTNGYVAGEPLYADYTNENDRFKADVLSRPDVPTLDEYTAIPVEDFGAAMLRGMGWKEGGKVGKQRAGDSNVGIKEKPRIVERRPALLGIGAKEVPGGVGEEFGAWGKVARGKRKVDLAYSPVVMKSSITGELLTEEELKDKREKQAKEDKEKEKGGDDWRERRDRNLKNDADRKGEKRERERDRLMLENGKSSERSRSKESRRRNRSRSSERTHRDRSRSKERRRRDRSRENGDNRHSSSRRHSRSRERDYRHASSRRERSRSAERRHRRH